MPNDTCMAATGQCFSITKPGIIPRLIAELYADRSSIKKKMLKLKREKADDKDIAKFDTKQLALKILMNTLYGALSNEYFRYFDPRIAEGITVTGQYTIRSAEKAVNDWMNKRLQTKNVDYVIAIDTDSLYVNFGPMVKKFMSDKSKQQILDVLDKDVAPRMEKLFEETYKKLQAKMNCKTQMMQMKREVIADKGIWTGKKHYMLSVLDSEGVRYDEPDIKMMGIEAVRSSTPNIFRKLIKKTIQTIMTKDEQAVQDLIRKERDKILDKIYNVMLGGGDINPEDGGGESFVELVNSEEIRSRWKKVNEYFEELS